MPLPDRVRLILLFGGRSAEHEVSCTTAAHVLAAIDHDRYDAVPVGITKAGEWLRSDDAIAALRQGAKALPDRLEATGTAVEPLPTMQPVTADVPVVVLPLLHGPYGEDGTVQGLLELANVPYVGTGVLGSAVSMDKAAAKEMLSAHGLPQCAWESAQVRDIDDEFLALVADRLGYPIFVKPANMGSSIGVSKVRDAEQLAAAVTEAARYDDWLVFEENVDGRELECGILGNATPRASVIGEVRPGADFYDYDDKYADGAELLIPAPLPQAVSDELRALAVQTFEALRCEGMARVDFFWEEDGRGPLINEVNTIPGFTPISQYPRLWEASGIPYAKLIDELVALALERHERRSRFSTER
ncbi:D-alanine--D-alanine ligase family protein [Actinospongicola halichondriae]|uniref:D-alanine--D-alanine ligase family protein n=1 Tax=Actinospongicola halichondriae TaxID=3236844 RepID=UPI003D3DB365